MLDEKGVPKNYSKLLYADSISAIIGAIFGTSTVTMYAESGAGVAIGGRTGFTSLITALMFFLSIFLLPIFAFIPLASASAAAFILELL
jgi:AGZA family xanthine/uracil permease-like MFS transporter